MSKILILVLMIFISLNLYGQDNVGIGTTTPHASAILDLTATNKGFLPPRLTSTQRDGIGSPATGLIIYNTTNTRYEYYSGSSWVPIISNGLTSVGLAVPAELSVTGSPLVANGTLTVGWASQNQNLILASPNGSSGAPAFRALVANDIPNISTDKLTSGILPVARGGSGAATLTGILKGDGTNAVTGITNTTGQVTYWSDANTIGGVSKLTWDNTKSILGVDASVRLIPQATAPNSGAEVEGQFYYNDVANEIRYWNGTAWTAFGGGGSLPSGTSDQTLRNTGGANYAVTNVLRVTTSNIALGNSSSSFTPSSLLHSDLGNGVENYHKFTAGTTTGMLVTDGFDIGINTSGNAIINQREILPILISTNNIQRMKIMEDGKIGIGNFTTPAALLHTDAGSATGHYHKFTVGATTNQTVDDGFDIGVSSDGTASFNQHEVKDIDFISQTILKLKIASSGHFLVNTSLVYSPNDISDVNISAANKSYIKLSGTGTIAISGGVSGQILIIQKTGSGTATLTDGAGYKLTGDWVGSTDKTIQLIFDGTDWVEISRSLN